jgi:oligoribonuclease
VLGIFLDSETNGLNFLTHKIIEIAFKIVDIHTSEVKGDFQSVVAQSFEEWQKSDLDSLKVNGFSWEEVQKGQSSQAISEKIIQMFKRLEIKRGRAVFICQNPSFDRAFFCQLVNPEVQESLLWPYHWLDLASMYWAKSIQRGQTDPKYFPWETGFSKDKIATAYHLPSEEKPHRAMNGVKHLILCYNAVIGFPQKNSQNLEL